jgi:hypothetical protein
LAGLPATSLTPLVKPHPAKKKTRHTYTFHIWQHLIDFSSYKLSVGGLVNLDLASTLAAQPLQITCKDFQVRACGRDKAGHTLSGTNSAGQPPAWRARRPGCRGADSNQTAHAASFSP